MKRVIYIDMDNTLADFSMSNPNALRDMHQQGYFRNLQPVRYCLEVVRDLIVIHKFEVYILSACIDTPYCQREKKEWLQQFLPIVPKQNYIFLPVGQNKAEQVEARGTFLLDDYGKNLRQWRDAGGIPIRFDWQRTKSDDLQISHWYDLTSLLTRILLY